MKTIDEVLEYNKKFVETEAYKPLVTTKFPDKKIAILTCMDTRLVELLPAALGVRNGDVKILKNAGGIVSHPYGSVMRSLIIAIYELGVNSIWVVGHTDCGMENMDVDRLVDKMVDRGIEQKTINIISHSGIDFRKWLGGFCNSESAVKDTIKQIVEHPLIPEGVEVEGFVIDSLTGELTRM